MIIRFLLERLGFKSGFVQSKKSIKKSPRYSFVLGLKRFCHPNNSRLLGAVRNFGSFATGLLPQRIRGSHCTGLATDTIF